MQTVSELYSQLWRNAAVTREHKAVIDGVEYGEKDIVGTPLVIRPLFGGSSPTVGSCAAGQLDISVIPKGNIPRMAEIRMFTRLVLGEQVSEWIPKGVFYIDTRKLDNESGVLTTNCFDAMLKGDKKFVQEGDVGQWPRTSPEIVSQICAQMGVELDERSELDETILVPVPEYEDMTRRELLSMVATAHCGNWTMTDAGKLRLVPLWSIPEATHYLVDQYGDPITLGGVKILVD